MRAFAAEIREADTDLLLVSFGCPKQEKWLSMNRHQLGKGVGIGVGATVDFLAGEMKRAPVWMRENGLEWVFRLAQEPRRLFRRYAKDLFTFSWMVPREFLRRMVTSWQAQPIKTVPYRPVAPLGQLWLPPRHADQDRSLPMNIALTTSVIQRGKSGVGRYVLALTEAMLAQTGDHRLTLFVLEEDLPLFDFAKEAATLVPVPETWRPAVKNIAWHHAVLPSLLRRHRIDVLHTPSYRRMTIHRRSCTRGHHP